MKGKLYIKTHGCQMNEYDSAKMRDVLMASHNLELTSQEEEADVGKRSLTKSLKFVTFVQRKKPAQAKVDTTQEIVEGYESKIRQAREKLGLSHEELGKKINEKASVLSKLETGKMTPNNVLVTGFPISPSRETTLGDLIQLNKKGEEEPTERKQS